MYQLRLVWSRDIPLRLQRSQLRLLPCVRGKVSVTAGIGVPDLPGLENTTAAGVHAPFSHAFSSQHTLLLVPRLCTQLLQDHHKHVWLLCVPLELRSQQVPLRLRWQLIRDVQDMRQQLWKRQVQNGLHWAQRGHVHQLRQQLRFWTVPRAVLIPEPRAVRVVPIVPGWTAACRLQLPGCRHM